MIVAKNWLLLLTIKINGRTTMNKKYILALLSGTLLFANAVFGETKDNESTSFDDMETPKEEEGDTSKKSPNPFTRQEKKLVKHFDAKKSQDVFALEKEDPFLGTDPWEE